MGDSAPAAGMALFIGNNNTVRAVKWRVVEVAVLKIRWSFVFTDAETIDVLEGGFAADKGDLCSRSTQLWEFFRR